MELLIGTVVVLYALGGLLFHEVWTDSSQGRMVHNYSPGFKWACCLFWPVVTILVILVGAILYFSWKD